jgi:4-alpha-glucanotransferase
MNMLSQRRAGVLLHITSLPSDFGVGDLGRGAHEFVDFLSKAGQTLWQILPINPTTYNFGNSPYHSLSTFAGNYILISPEKLYESGLIKKDDLEEIKVKRSNKVEYKLVYDNKKKILRKAFLNFDIKKDEFQKFLFEQKWWLESYAVFSAIREKTKKEWYEWDDELKKMKEKEKEKKEHENKEKDEGSISSFEKLKKELEDDFYFFVFEQFIFFKQWFELKSYANSKGVFIIGDMPIYPAYSSCDVWENPHLFKLDENMNMVFVSGVPPDFFSPTGQLWGNPVYNWQEHEKEGFRWWIKRFSHLMKLYDYIRVDHFRGFIAYWEVPSYEKTAINGRWVQVPYFSFFKTIFRNFPFLPIIAEDLGFITEDVKYVKEYFGIPGMKVLQFAFYEENSPYLPHNAEKNSVIYTGTHDNPPTRAWFKKLDAETKLKVEKYVGVPLTEDNICYFMIRLAYSSPSQFAIIPMQDILCLDEDSRMNTPGKADGNWEWRLENLPDEKVAFELYELSKIYGRI